MLNLIDLAGSERLNTSGATGDRLKVCHLHAQAHITDVPVAAIVVEFSGIIDCHKVPENIYFDSQNVSKCPFWGFFLTKSSRKRSKAPISTSVRTGGREN